jgi:L-glutamine-phosphate cytidylyltransferase
LLSGAFCDFLSVVNAIIMAAGTGTRLRPLTDDRPKALIEVGGVPVIERQIRFFRERGVGAVTIVTGHRARRLDYLADKFPDIAFVPNEAYDIYNNIYSMYLVRDRLGDGYVSESDVFMHENYIDPRPARSLIFGGFRKGFAREWIIRHDENLRIHRIDVQGGEGIIQAGLSYWTAPAADLLRQTLEEMIGGGHFADTYWDDVFMSCFGRMDVFLKEIDPRAWTEIDSKDDLLEAEAKESRFRFRTYP